MLKIELCSISLRKKFINNKSIMRSQKNLFFDEFSMKKKNKSTLILVEIIRKRVGKLYHIAMSRFDCLEASVLHKQDSLNISFPNV